MAGDSYAQGGDGVSERKALCQELIDRHGTRDWNKADRALIEWVTLPWYKRLFWWIVGAPEVK